MTEHEKKRMVTAVFRDRTQANRVYTWLRDRVKRSRLRRS